MTTTIGGEIFTPEKIKDFHKKMIESYNLPSWIFEMHCDKCNEKIGILGIRSIGLCLNASRIGDIEVNVSCFNCSKGYSLYFRNECKNIDDFILTLKSPQPPSIPVSQEKLDSIDNNLLEKMIDLYEKGLWNINIEG